MTSRNQLTQKYLAYQSLGHAVFAVTLSTYVTSEAFAASDRIRHFWDNHFIYRVKCRLPPRAKLDHDWTLEISDDGYYHYHGFVAVEGKHGSRIWTSCGPHKKLIRALDSFSKSGTYRPFRVNKCLVEPVTNAAAWSTYITKQSSSFL